MTPVDLADRKAKFDGFLEERMPVLVDFVRALGFQEPHRVLNEPHLFIAGVGSWVEAQQVGVEDRAWLASRIGYLIGEYLVTQLGGHWLLCERADSKYFGHYVVGGFLRARNPEAVADPMEAGMAVVDGTEKLASLVEEIKLAVLRA
jgi:hypothetical protein